jgi:Pilus assembly protein, PilO
VLRLLLGTILLAQVLRPFADERLLLDRRLETLRRILPDGPVAAADVVHIRDLAEDAQLEQVEVKARPPVESGTSGQVSYELSAFGAYGQVERFFRRVALSHRLIDVESVTLTAANEGVVRLEAVLRFPFWPRNAPLPPPPESPGGRPAGVPRPTLYAYLRDSSLALGKSEAIETWRRERRNPRLFLSELAAVVRDRPVVLGYAHDADTFNVRGLAVGESTVRGLESRFESGFFRVTDFLMAKQGACHRFEVTGTSPVAGPDAEPPVSVEDPFLPDPTPCRVDRDPPRSFVVRGKAPTARNPGNGPLTLRLREVDFADVFQALSLVSGAGFVVDDNVVGRVSLDVTRATLAETLDLLRRETRVWISERGPVRRVSATPQETPAPGPSGGDPVSFSLKRAEVADVLAVMTDIDPELAVLGPPGFLGRLSVWASGVPLETLRAAVVDAAGLVERVEEDRRVLERGTGSGEAPVPVARVTPEPRLVLRPEELAVLEFDLAGVASSGDGWLAFSYSPTGRLHAYRRGDRLADAVVQSIESTDVVLETSEGPLRIALPAPSN